ANGQYVVEPGEVAVRAVAAKLGLQFAMLDFAALLQCKRFDRLLCADIVDADSLVLVDEEDGALRGGDQLLDLVLAEVPVQSALLIEAMCLVDDEDVELVRPGLDEGAGTHEQVGIRCSRHRADELRLVDLAGRGVLGDVATVEARLQQPAEQVYGQNGLAGAWATFDDDGAR